MEKEKLCDKCIHRYFCAPGWRYGHIMETCSRREIEKEG